MSDISGLSPAPKILKRHNKNDGRHDWWVNGQTRWLAADGTRRGTMHHWLVAVCNNTTCPAEAVIESFAVGRLIEGTSDDC